MATGQTPFKHTFVVIILCIEYDNYLLQRSPYDLVCRLTVNKEGNNKGRQFYVCMKPQGSNERCNFFQWADEPGGSSGFSSNQGQAFQYKKLVINIGTVDTVKHIW